MSEPAQKPAGECPAHKKPWVWREGTSKAGRAYAGWYCPEPGCNERPVSPGDGQRSGGSWRGKSPEELAQQKELAHFERSSIERQTALKAAIDWAKSQTPITISTEEIVAFAKEFATFLARESAPASPTAAPEPAKAATPATDAAKGVVNSADSFWKSVPGDTTALKQMAVTAALGMTVRAWLAQDKSRTWADALAQVQKMQRG